MTQTAKFAEMFVRFTDGTGRVVRTERNEPVMRRDMEKDAFRWMERPTVESVQVSFTDRTAQTGGKGRYR